MVGATIVGLVMGIFLFFLAGLMAGRDDEFGMAGPILFFGALFFICGIVGAVKVAKKEVRTDTKPVITAEIRQTITGNETQADTVYIYQFEK